MTRVAEKQLEEIEGRLLLEGVYQQYGYDLRSYRASCVEAWIQRRLIEEGLSSVSALQDRILRDAACLDRLLLTVADNGSTFFRDPPFWRALRDHAVPRLRTYPSVTIWQAGCAGGEETWSLAILLQEEGLYERCRIYATDQSPAVVKAARAGSFSLNREEKYARAYADAGGKGRFAAYYRRGRATLRFDATLRKNIIFATHCLVTDEMFNEFHLIMCRNVLYFFTPPLQQRVMDLLHRSLTTFGYLGLGSGESLLGSRLQWSYEPVNRQDRLYRKVRA